MTERCNCDASCGENRYHDFGSAGCRYEVKTIKKAKASKPTIIHVNQLVIRSNAKQGLNEPPLTFRKGRNGRESTRAHEVEIHGPSKIVHSPHDPLPCGARVWIETFAEVNYK